VNEEKTMSVVKEGKPLIVVEERARQAARLPVATVPADASALMKIIDRAAMDPNFDVAKLEKLLAVRDQWEETEARKAYNVAFSSFKAEAVIVVKNRGVTDGPLKGKRYAELFSVVNAVTPLLSKYGLSHSWNVKSEKELIAVTCTLKHVLGHSESVTIDGPPDAGGAKNAIQARASTITYLERYTLKAVCGIAEQGDDNDGAGGGGEQLDENAFADHLAAIDAADSKEALMKAFGAAWKSAEVINDVRAMKKFGDRKEQRKAKLGIKS
jgi:hypothetical protein